MTKVKIGYRDTFKNGDKNAPFLKEELANYHGKHDSDYEISHFGDRTMEFCFSARWHYTSYG